MGLGAGFLGGRRTRSLPSRAASALLSDVDGTVSPGYNMSISLIRVFWVCSSDPRLLQRGRHGVNGVS